MTSPRRRKTAVSSLLRQQRRKRIEQEDLLWDRMPAVGREFGSPDFERLMAEDHRNRGIDPELKDQLPEAGNLE